MTLADLMQNGVGDALPPVHDWNPASCGDSEMRIAADGRWYHQGSPIARDDMVRLFARILRREPDGGYVIVTPVEKLAIAVDDVPFVATELRRIEQADRVVFAFRINTGETVVANEEHRIEMRGTGAAVRPYLHVRGGLDAVIARPVFYTLADHAEERDGVLGVSSAGLFFPLEPGA